MRLLIIGSLGGQIGEASQIAASRGALVSQANDVEAGLNSLRSGQGADLIMIDCKLDISPLVSSLKKERISVPVVACGVENDSRAAVNAIKAGAQEYVPLPPDQELISAIFEAVVEVPLSLVYEDPKMGKLIQVAEKVAKSNASILVVGDSGTGKELIARHIYKASERSKASFVAINCAAIPENLLESELFGYEKGAFTGAVGRRIGKFEEANKGTLLLDEISEMDIRLQAKLLRAIQEKEIDRIGGTKPIKVDVRIIATSNRDLQNEVSLGNFREDLYFRLNVMTINVPKLSERPGDIKPLSEYFCRKYSESNGLGEIKITAATNELLTDYSWPGNVRELENTIHRGVLLCSDNRIEPDHINIGEVANKSNEFKSPHSSKEDSVNDQMIGKTVAEVEKDLIIGTLQHCLGNRTHAANILGISIRTLRNKLRTYSEMGVIVPSSNSNNEHVIT
tara:strand:+ start:3075 stop:4433 length:1359 start_codon:yes stop_codon:yes gene_type:complete